jgi:hypothetical protein
MVVEVAWVAATADPTAATVGDAGDLLDVDMDQLAGPVALIAAHGHGRGSVPAVEPA